MLLTLYALHTIQQAPRESWDVMAWIPNGFIEFTKWVLFLIWLAVLHWSCPDSIEDK